ncbi:MAG: hypothetical protein ABI417_21175 [Coleofasciculaceae cyanobacterium]
MNYASYKSDSEALLQADRYDKILYFLPASMFLLSCLRSVCNSILQCNYPQKVCVILSGVCHNFKPNRYQSNFLLKQILINDSRQPCFIGDRLSLLPQIITKD